MRIAVAYEDGMIYQHFGHTPQFKIYDAVDGYVLSAVVTDTDGHGHGALADFLRQVKADVLICGGIGGGARLALEEAGIRLCGGVTGEADEAVEAFLAGDLAFNPDVCCTHHDHGNSHTCGSHGCGHCHHET